MKIIAAVDESQHSCAVLDFLCSLPLPENAELVLAHVVEDLTGYAYGTHVRTLLAETVQKQHEETGRTVLRHMHDRVSSRFHSVRQELLHGHVGDRISALAEREQAGLIVLGARGANALERFLLGSTSEQVASHAGCSVLIGHRAVAPERPEDGRLKILVACDGSDQAEAALDEVARLPLGSTAEVELVTVQTLVTSFHMDVVQHLSAEWKDEHHRVTENLERAANRLRSSGIENVRVRVPEGGDVAAVLLKIAETWNADLIMIGASRKNTLDRFLLGSVSRRVLRHSLCNVWVAR